MLTNRGKDIHFQALAPKELRSVTKPVGKSPVKKPLGQSSSAPYKTGALMETSFLGNFSKVLEKLWLRTRSVRVKEQ